MLAKVENNVVQKNLCRETGEVSMNWDALDGVARGRGVSLVDETCQEREWERKWMGASMERSNAFFYQNVASCERDPLVLSAGAAQRIETACYIGFDDWNDC